MRCILVEISMILFYCMCAEADIEAHQEYKERHKMKMTAEKKKVSPLLVLFHQVQRISVLCASIPQDLEMLQNYKPWGKPAAGAPRVSSNDNRMWSPVTKYYTY